MVGTMTQSLSQAVLQIVFSFFLGLVVVEPDPVSRTVLVG